MPNNKYSEHNAIEYSELSLTPLAGTKSPKPVNKWKKFFERKIKPWKIY
jgi:hypothetical protein